MLAKASGSLQAAVTNLLAEAVHNAAASLATGPAETARSGRRSPSPWASSCTPPEEGDGEEGRMSSVSPLGSPPGAA